MADVIDLASCVKVQDEQEEGEVEEDDMEVGTEELKISSNKVEKPEEGKKAEASAEMEELQVSVPQVRFSFLKHTSFPTVIWRYALCVADAE